MANGRDKLALLCGRNGGNKHDTTHICTHSSKVLLQKLSKTIKIDTKIVVGGETLITNFQNTHLSANTLTLLWPTQNFPAQFIYNVHIPLFRCSFGYFSNSIKIILLHLANMPVLMHVGAHRTTTKRSAETR